MPFQNYTHKHNHLCKVLPGAPLTGSMLQLSLEQKQSVAVTVRTSKPEAISEALRLSTTVAGGMQSFGGPLAHPRNTLNALMVPSVRNMKDAFKSKMLKGM